MRKTLTIAVALVAIVLLPATAFAWGAVAHRSITKRAIELLPPEIRPFFESRRDELVLRSNDPDLWRVVGFDDESPNHMIDFGVAEYGPYPFTALPRAYDAAVEKFGVATVRRNGLLPWRTMEEFGNLRRVMEGFPRGQPYAGGNTILFGAALAHYIEDAHQPLHAHKNYDGQLSGQRGLHSRFESELVERFESRLVINPAPARSIPDTRDFIFEIAMKSFQRVPDILQADKEAAAGRDTYDDRYFERFFVSMKPLLERQLAAAMTATASAIVTAWEQAGKPALKSTPRRPAKVGKP
jgi:hypothetical protein